MRRRMSQNPCFTCALITWLRTAMWVCLFWCDHIDVPAFSSRAALTHGRANVLKMPRVCYWSYDTLVFYTIDCGLSSLMVSPYNFLFSVYHYLTYSEFIPPAASMLQKMQTSSRWRRYAWLACRYLACLRWCCYRCFLPKMSTSLWSSNFWICNF